MKNAVSAYSIRILSLAIPLLSIPLLSKTLSSEKFGDILRAQSISNWLLILVEFGFIYTATRKIAISRSDPIKLGIAINEIQSAKLILLILYILVCSLALLFGSNLFGDPIITLIFVIAYGIQGMWPYWYFQGIEKIQRFALVEAVFRLLSLLVLYVFINPLSGEYIYSIMYLLSNFFILALTTRGMWKDVGINKFSFNLKISDLLESLPSFLTRVGSSLYMMAPIVVIGSFLGSNAAAIYGGADKIFRTATAMISPISDVIFSRLNYVKSQSSELYGKWLLLSFCSLLFLSTSISLVIYHFSGWIVGILLGDSLKDSEQVLKVLSWGIPAIGIGTFGGIHVLMTQNRDRIFTYIVVIAGLFSGVSLIFLVKNGILTEVLTARVVVATEWIVATLTIVIGTYRLCWDRILSRRTESV